MTHHNRGISARGRSRSLRLEALEGRYLMAADVVVDISSLGNIQLRITGSDGPDDVYVVHSPISDGVMLVENGRAEIIDERFHYIYFEGGAGDDRFVNFTDIPSAINGGAGADVLFGGTTHNAIAGDEGNDEIYGRGVYDYIWGDSPGDDELGDDYFPDDYVWGTGGNDTIYGGVERNYIFGGPGDDTIHGNGTTNFIEGGAGKDVVIGGSDFDWIWGGPGTDILRGEGGDDILYGENGNDILIGGDGDDTLFGGNGRDLVIGGAGEDVLIGSNPSLRGLPLVRGGEPGDILIGGTTDFDANDKALMTILKAWSEPLPAKTRAENIEHGVGPRGRYALNSRSIHDDGDVDRFEGSEEDWILGGGEGFRPSFAGR